MPYAANHGPPDLDAVHTWTPASGAVPPALNNRQTDPPTYPWIKVLGISGWRSAPDSDDNREPRTSTDGEIGYPGKLQGKTLVYECEIRARVREDMRAVMHSCINGFSDRHLLGTMTVTPYTVPGGVTWQYQARVLSLDADPTWTYEELRPWPYAHGFALSLRMLNPFFYTPNLAGAAAL